MWVFKSSCRFVRDEDGAVSADWIVLTAFCIGVCVAASLATGGSVADFGREIDAAMTKCGIPTYGSGSKNAGL